MIICICSNVSDAAIREAAACGARSLGALRERLGVANRCGKCACMATKILAEQPGASAATRARACACAAIECLCASLGGTTPAMGAAAQPGEA